MHHAFLFTGIDGVGRFHAAMHFAMMCNCETHLEESHNHKPCGECKTCRRVISNQHPDMIHIQPDGVSIKIDQIRSLRKKLTYKPVIAKTRFVFLVKANAMTIESSNALLKILEEPPSNTIFILIVENQKDVLQTISSRCQQIRFNPGTEKSVFDDLAKTEALEPEMAWIIAKLSMGSFIRANQFQKKKWINKRTFILNHLNQLDQLSIGMRLCFAEQLSKNKDDIPDILEMILTWFRDVLVYRFSPERIINIDYKNQIYAHAIKYSSDVIIKKIEQIQIVQKDLMANMNKRLAFEQLMLIHL
jgi:DNA polymerase-3 subunit delta'